MKTAKIVQLKNPYRLILSSIGRLFSKSNSQNYLRDAKMNDICDKVNSRLNIAGSMITTGLTLQSPMQPSELNLPLNSYLFIICTIF